MLSFRKETDYALQFMQYLAKDITRTHSLKKFAIESGISFYFLQKIARKLAKARLISAVQGVNGGYRIEVNPKKLTLYRVIEVMEEGVRLLPCVGKMKYECKKGRSCEIKKIMAQLNVEISKVLQRINII